jgi:cell division septum initiation protein DivIVA
MKKISLWVLIVVFTVSHAPAQESATQQQIDKLSGQIQDLLETTEKQRIRIDALEKEIAELRDKVNTPAVNNYADRSELKSLAEQVQEVDRKRREDSDMIATQIQNLVKAATMAPPPQITHKTSSASKSSSPDEPTPTSSIPSKGYEYVVKQGDNLGLIIKAYRDKGVKVKLSQIKAANPQMNADVLIPGSKIFIPDANAK